MRKYFIILASTVSTTLGLSFSAKAAEPVTASIGADLVSNYLWRGQKLDAFSIQPSVGLEWSGLSLSAWGSHGLTGTFGEVDFTLAYSTGGFTVGVTDYFCADSFDGFFVYGEDTPHVAEVNLGYDFGFLSLNWYTNFWGAMGETPEGKKSYSSYFEIAAPFSLGGLDWSAALGVSPWANDFYGTEGFGIVNCSLTASKDIEIGSVTIPAFVQLMANPVDNHLFMCVGVSF